MRYYICTFSCIFLSSSSEDSMRAVFLASILRSLSLHNHHNHSQHTITITHSTPSQSHTAHHHNHTQHTITITHSTPSQSHTAHHHNHTQHTITITHHHNHTQHTITITHTRFTYTTGPCVMSCCVLSSCAEHVNIITFDATQCSNVTPPNPSTTPTLSSHT